MQLEDQSLHIRLVDLPSVHQRGGDASKWDNNPIDDYKNTFLTQRNNFEVSASNRARLILESDQNFKNEMNTAISNLERNPIIKNKVWKEIEDFHLQLENEKGLKGLIAG